MTKVKVGDLAPEISGTDQHGNPISLKDFRGKKLVLYFYPKDMTPGCTAQACNLRDNYELLKAAGYEILGVSVDDAKKHVKFIEKYELPFSLLADTEKKTVEDYGLWIEKSLYGRKYMGTDRKTFIIDEEGRVERIIEKVKTADHTSQILDKA